ncbi:nucleoside ABC transporter membrane protein [Tindallia magadiensis]|uniref:Nucleoside ABC transporter membrane protein n=1 Tax=Tindallia magadiensis TaxID=69895 RepID=A0A1I3BYV5_9FIRM|nr:ABC transporter permease [Tindallia magadiensis]SFH67485.1 nucleoside ABC transporter membrane protein [Tindallia magadiensis]
MNKKNPLVTLLGNEKWQWLSIPIFAVLLSILAGSIVILLMGKNPLTAYLSILQGAGWIPKANYAGGTGMLTDFTSFLDALAPMIFAALAVTVGFRAGLFNIGIAGQMLLAGFFATLFVGYSDLPWYLAKPLVILIAITVGGLAAGFVGYLKHRFNISEVVSTIMLNYMIAYVTSYYIKTYFVNPVSRQSEYIQPAASLTLKNLRIAGIRVDLPIGIFLAILAALFVYYLLYKTRLGFEIKAVGANKQAAEYAGISIGRTIVVAMMISGALAGLAGATFYLGHYASMQPGVLAGLGYNAIATSLLGNNHPLGVLLASALITTLDKGATYMSSRVGVVQEISGVITSLILLFSATGTYIRYRISRQRQEQKEKQEQIHPEGGEEA